MLAFAALSLSGCYRYVQIEPAQVPSGEDVRLLVTQQGAAEFREVAPGAVAEGAGRLPALRGKLVRRDGDDLLLAVRIANRQVGFQSVALEQTLRIPAGEVLALERRELDKLTTAAAIAGAAAAGTALLLAIIETFGNPSGPEPDPDFLLKLFSIPVG